MVRRVGAALLLALSASAFAAEFSGGVGGSWEFAARGERCTLQQPLGDYGLARFSGEKGKGLHFEVLAHRELFADGAVRLDRVAPAWHDRYPLEEPLGELSHLGGAGVRVAEPVATQVLLSLYEGFDARLRHSSWYANDPTAIVIEVSSVGFRALYEDFIRCAQGSPVVGWELAPDDIAALRRVARFVQGDPWLTGVFVDGHTDAMGTQRGNYQLSKKRAEVVRQCLVDEGVDPKLLTVRFHGAAYPVADNESEAGRALNRRTTVRLERRWPEVAQAD